MPPATVARALPDRILLCTRCGAGVLHPLAPGLLYCPHCGYRGPEGTEYLKAKAKGRR